MQTTLLERHHRLGARFIERDGFTLPRDFGDVRGEYAALQNGAGVIDLAHFGVLRVEGRDRVAWLHKLVTANVQTLAEGAGAYSLLLNAKGHVAADFIALVQNDALLLYTSWRAKEKLLANLRRAIFREKVALTDVSDAFAILSLQGPQVERVLRLLFVSLPSAQDAFQFSALKFQDADVFAARSSRAGSVGFDLVVPREHAAALWDALIGRGARPVGFDALNVARVEAGIAWYSDDFDETVLALEARLDAFIAENKGCYTGQEVIARLKNRGHVNRLLVQLLITHDTSPQRGDLIFADDQEVGWITSVVWSFARNASLALGYTRREIAAKGARVQVKHDNTRLDAQVQMP